MDIDRFQAILDAYGATAARWPAAERDAAAALAANDPRARALLSEAAALDRWLDTEPLAAPTPGLAGRISATFPARAAGQPPASVAGLTRFWRALWIEHVWQPAAALGLSAALGLVVGLGPASALADEMFLDEPFAIRWQGDAFGDLDD